MAKKFGHQLRLQVRPGVDELILDRPDVHNAFNDEMIESLIATLEDVAVSNHTRLLVLKAQGPSFCAGADLNWMKRMKSYSYEENLADSKQLAKLFYCLSRLPMTTMAQVQGGTFGGGVGLVACCDFVMATDKAKFCLSEVKLGLVPAVISPYVMGKIGSSWARAYFNTGLIFSAHKAFHMGLVHEVVEEAKWDESCDKMMSKILESAPQASREAKQLVFGLEKRKGETFSEIENFTCQTIARVRTTDEAQEGMQALLDKKSPSWRS